MRRRIVSLLFAFPLLATITLSSCDDGKIYDDNHVVEREGSTVKLTAKVSGGDTWAAGYSLVLAGFEEGNEYAQLAKGISVDGNGTATLVMSGVTSNIKELEVCVINKLRKRIVSFYTVDFTEQSDTVRLDAGTIDASMYAGIQQAVFNENCVNCHGASTGAAAGLYLTAGKSYAHLVNVKAVSSEGERIRVVPGSVEESFLMDVLEKGASPHHHTDILSAKTDRLSLLEDWIEAGAKE